MRTLIVFGATAAAGLVVWLAIAAVTGMREAWDSGLFFTVGVPAMFAASAVAGFVEPKRAWLWGVAVVSPQIVALFLASGVGPLSVVGLVIFGVLAVICIAGSLVGATLKQRRLSARER